MPLCIAGMLGKSCLYEEAIRVPLLLSMPGVIPGGQKLSVPVSTLDIAPTILGIVDMLGRGQKHRSIVPGSPEPPLLHGRSLTREMGIDRAGNLPQFNDDISDNENTWAATASVTLTHGRW